MKALNQGMVVALADTLGQGRGAAIDTRTLPRSRRGYHGGWASKMRGRKFPDPFGMLDSVSAGVKTPYTGVIIRKAR